MGLRASPVYIYIYIRPESLKLRVPPTLLYPSSSNCIMHGEQIDILNTGKQVVEGRICRMDRGEGQVKSLRIRGWCLWGRLRVVTRILLLATISFPTLCLQGQEILSEILMYSASVQPNFRMKTCQVAVITDAYSKIGRLGNIEARRGTTVHDG